ncbi:MAG TPA: glycosyltransferase [Stellaceae bacterium]|nr:glycosyltransferase [Stellaceae bacterium]
MPRAGTRPRPRLVSVNFFPAFAPAASGGELRYLNLYRALSEYCDIDLVTSTDFGTRYEEIWHTPSLCEHRFPKDEGWRRAFQTLEGSRVSGDLSGLAFALAVSDPNCALRQAAVRLARSATAVIHEFPYSEAIFRDLPPGCEIYNSHNFELGLLSSNLSGEGSGRCFQKLFHLERDLAARAKLVFATSDTDGEKFRLVYDVSPERLRYCPNGYAEAELAPVEAARRRRAGAANERPQLLFLASRHQPNVEAAEFLFDLAADLGECDMIIAGGVSEAFRGRDLPENVRLTGPLGGAEKQAALVAADLLVNAVVRGSGTSLKSIEALAGFLPMVATPEAVRGLGVESGTHAIVCSRRQFADAVRTILANPEERTRMAEAGLALARDRYSWSNIARQFRDELAALDAAPGHSRRRKTPRRQPLLLALNDYPIDAAASGGSIRIKEVLRALAADIILLTFGPAYEVGLLAPGFLQITVEKSPQHQSFEQRANAGQQVSANDIAAALFVSGHHVLSELAAQLASRSTLATFEHCYMAPVAEWLRKARPDLPIVYDAHNVEARIKRQLLAHHPWGSTLIPYVAEIERRLAATADLVATCTEADAEHFRSLGATAIVVGNGSAPAIADARTNGRVVVGFLGSAHPPNFEAATYIVDSVAPIFPDVTFEFVGGVCETLSSDALPDNVVLRGGVDEAAKSRILGGWSVALNPVLTGGGSSLKLPDYLAHGLATISTPEGSRGFAVEREGVGRVVDRDEFPSVLWHLLADDELRSEYALKARAYAQRHLRWEAQTAPLRQWFGRLGARPGPAGAERRRSLLVVTYRYTEPPLGGAEEYLIELLRWLRPQFRTIELAAVDVVGPLANRHHFGCGFAAGGGTARVLGELFDAVRLFAADPVPEDMLLATCRQLERAQLRSDLALYAPFVKSLRKNGAAMPLGGFYWPEHYDGKVQRWTSGEFSFLLPPGTRVFCLDGWTPRQKQLVVSAVERNGAGGGETTELHRQYIDDNFSLKLALAEDASPEIILCTVDEHAEPNDHRPFGVLLDWGSVLVQSGDNAAPRRNRPLAAAPVRETQVDLGLELDRLLPTENFAAWVERLSAVAQARPEAEERAFASVRGPHSWALQAWLAEQGGRYEVVLVQGIPFDTVPSTVETLDRLERRPRIVVLPHFHGEDRFYYWRRYLDSLTAADKVLLFSRDLARRLGDPAKNAVVPGGGINIEEEASEELIARFREVHEAETPFFLVLGRKTASKGYERVIRALRALREAGWELDLVVIGPDDDELPVEEDGVDYLGFQPREIVLGALSACLGLVTMSVSESFGIVVCEAWKFRKPVIANRACAAFRELVADGETGLLVDTDEELSLAMEKFALDPELCESLGKAGFERAVSAFAWQQVADLVGDALIG